MLGSSSSTTALLTQPASKLLLPALDDQTTIRLYAPRAFVSVDRAAMVSVRLHVVSPATVDRTSMDEVKLAQSRKA
jgi:hypothetical protein